MLWWFIPLTPKMKFARSVYICKLTPILAYRKNLHCSIWVVLCKQTTGTEFFHSCSQAQSLETHALHTVPSHAWGLLYCNWEHPLSYKHLNSLNHCRIVIWKCSMSSYLVLQPCCQMQLGLQKYWCEWSVCCL